VSAGQRIAILVAAVVVLAGAFVIARGSDDEGGSESARTEGEQTVSQPPEEGTVTSEGTGGETAPSNGEPAETQPAQPAPRIDVVRIRGLGPVGEPKTITYDSGDTVRLRFTSDQAAEVHLHGYDRTVQVPSGGSKRLTFKANAEGIFEVEEHHSGEILAKLQVEP
jgi:FtsP/CotA-like multicopper oxidase with cupredoxin domain